MLWWTLAMSPQAVACGGLMCDSQQPVLQAAERIVFGVDPDGEIEMHVQVTYEGPSEDFAWIVPVPSDPEVFLTTSLLFTQFGIPTDPTFTLNMRTEGECWESRAERRDKSGGDSAAGGLDAGSTNDTDSNYFDVTVLDEQTLGPYEIVELTAASVDDMTGWLQDNGYDIPDGLGPVLEPYLLDDAVFVALKLAKDRDAGDLAPLGLRFAAANPSVPVQLTSVAAAPDLRMEVYVFSDARAVPDSYLHVRINEAALDWWNQGANYDDVITQAANEAGGHAFATDSHLATSVFAPLWRATGYSEETLRATPDPSLWMEVAITMMPSIPAELAQVVDLHIGLPSGVLSADFINCPSCFEASWVADVDAATDDLELMVLEPLRTAQALLDDHDWVTRMTSSLDAAEMTVDPTFVLNSDLASEEIGVSHVAEFVTDCTPRRTRAEDALRKLVLADGRELWMPSGAWMFEHNTTPFEYLEEHGALAAQVVEQLSETGDGEILVDHTSDLAALADAHNAEVFDLFRGGCGCTADVGEVSVASWTAVFGRRRM